jgi:hypothetical protein
MEALILDIVLSSFDFGTMQLMWFHLNVLPITCSWWKITREPMKIQVIEKAISRISLFCMWADRFIIIEIADKNNTENNMKVFTY